MEGLQNGLRQGCLCIREGAGAAVSHTGGMEPDLRRALWFGLGIALLIVASVFGPRCLNRSASTPRQEHYSPIE